MGRSLQQRESQQKIFTRRLADGKPHGRYRRIARWPLYFLQVIEGQKMQPAFQREQNQSKSRIAVVCLILDRFGIPIATNSPSYRAVLVAETEPER